MRARGLPSLLPILLAPALLAQQPAPPTDPNAGEATDLIALRDWLTGYRTGSTRFVKDGRTDQPAIQATDALMANVARWNTLGAAQALFECAVVAPRPPAATSAAELVDFQRELQPWRVQAMAQRHLRAMSCPELLPWLIAKLGAPGIRGAQANDDTAAATAVLKILGGHPSDEAKLELLRACGSMPTELRVVAVNAMARDATVELVPTLIELLRDKEPNVRIAAANAIGTALQPHVDETLGKHPTGELLKLRDQAIARLEELVVKDKVWQVRSAAAFGMASMRCKPVIPALIRGLDAELKKKQDPWAMDVRLHKLLEGLTGQNVARGSVTPWQQFWAKEGASFAVQPQQAPGAPKQADTRYAKFFDLTIESDRVLFVVDFSGSMAEPAAIKATETSASPGGEQSTKAQLVVRELKRLVMSLPDDALLNFVVFSDDVRIWRTEGEHPALVKLDDAARDDVLGNFLDSLRPNGPTNLYGALDKALGFGGRGLYDKYYAAGFDTLYVISDGAPTVGEITDKAEIKKRVREANQLRKITIHCITFGDQNDTDFLREMAEENGGRHIHVQ